MMNRSKFLIIPLVLVLNFCNIERYPQQIGHFSHISNIETDSENFPNDKTMSEFTNCYQIGKQNFEENFMNQNLEKMANGDTSIVGFRDLKIEYKEYALYGYLGPAGICCVTYTGYAIRKKEIKNQD